MKLKIWAPIEGTNPCFKEIYSQYSQQFKKKSTTSRNIIVQVLNNTVQKNAEDSL